MMKGLLNVLHPTFDALSALADLSDVDAARSRVGRHVVQCAQCRSVLAEIRELGASARATVVEGAPDGMWERIEQAAKETREAPAPSRETPPPEATPWEAAPSLRPTRHWPVPVRRIQRSALRIGGALAVAAAALIVVVLVTGETPSLNASAPSRMAFTPFRPAPGTTVHVRYVPSPQLAKYDQLVLVGQYLKAGTRPPSDWYFGGDYDSLATLRKTADGAVVGDFTVPTDFQAVSLVVVEPSGAHYDSDGLYSWIVVGGDARGKPVLRNLLAAASLDALWGSRSQAAVLDTLQRYFPEHPRGFATAQRYRGEGVFADLLKFFKGAERKYVAFNSKLEKERSLDADRLIAMIDFAYHIEEPAEAAKWTKRLVREHPTDERTLTYYARMVHEIELKEPPLDSIRPLIPMLDTLYQRAPTRHGRFGEEFSLAARYGDSTMKRRWALHALDQDISPWRGLNIEEKWLADPEIRAKVTAQLRSSGIPECVRPRWVGRNWVSADAREQNCLRGRAQVVATMSHVALLDGRTAEALALADSSIRLSGQLSNCWLRTGRLAKANALLARGDTVGAAREFASAFTAGFDSWQGTDALRESYQRVRPVVDSAQWTGLITAARATMDACVKSLKKPTTGG